MYKELEYYKKCKYRWSFRKDLKLRLTRRVSFSQAARYIRKGHLIGIEPTPGNNHPGQYSFVLIIKNYAHYVPFVEDSNYIFLKTIIPNRDLNEKYNS